MAVAVLRADIEAVGLAEFVVVDSAGTSSWHVGEEADQRALDVLRQRGYGLKHTGRKFDRRWFGPQHPLRADLVLTMDAMNYSEVVAMAPDLAARSRVRMLRSFDPDLVDVEVGDPRLDVPDPYYEGTTAFKEVLAMIERASDGVVEALPTLLDR